MGSVWQRLFVTIVVGLILSGCTPSYTLKVDALKNSEFTQNQISSYVIVDAIPATVEHDIAFQEVTRYAKAALSTKGFFEAPDLDHADMIIEISYGIEVREDYKVYSVNSDYNVSSDAVRVVPVTIYDKYIRLDAYSNRLADGAESNIQLWSVKVINQDKNDDLSSYLPLMLAAAAQYLGCHTNHHVVVTMKGNDDVVLFIRRSL